MKRGSLVRIIKFWRSRVFDSAERLTEEASNRCASSERNPCPPSSGSGKSPITVLLSHPWPRSKAVGRNARPNLCRNQCRASHRAIVARATVGHRARWRRLAEHRGVALASAAGNLGRVLSGASGAALVRVLGTLSPGAAVRLFFSLGCPHSSHGSERSSAECPALLVFTNRPSGAQPWTS